MCSRFENKQTGISIFQKLKKDIKGNFLLEDNISTKKNNIAPKDEVITILKETEDNFKISTTNWGIQFDSTKSSPLIFNSRIETIKEKNFWKQLLIKNRCLLPATAFYEWREIDKIKIPHRISILNTELFYIASIYFIIEGNYFSSMITAEPNSFVKNIHNRMPVILLQNQISNFLNGSKEDSLNICQPLNDEIKMNVEIAEEILTPKQKVHLKK